MRFQLSLVKNSTGNELPINYQYEFASWAYKTIHTGDPEFASWLHNQGYTDGNKAFKLFTFSKLSPEKYGVKGDRLQLLSDRANLCISFYMPDTANPFITGLFKDQEFTIGDKKSKVGFRVNTVENLPEPEWKDEMSFRANSPIVISMMDKNISPHAQYLGPPDNRYEHFFVQNLLAKYTTLLARQPGLREVLHQKGQTGIRFEVTGNPHSKLVKIKAGSPDETTIKGYLYDFKIAAPAEILKIGYYAGFGEKNSMGFGCVEVIKNQPIQSGPPGDILSESAATNLSESAGTNLSESAGPDRVTAPYKKPDQV